MGGAIATTVIIIFKNIFIFLSGSSEEWLGGY